MSVDILGTNCDQCRSMVRCCFTSTETVRLIRTESPGRPPRLSHSSWTLPPVAIHTALSLLSPWNTALGSKETIARSRWPPLRGRFGTSLSKVPHWPIKPCCRSERCVNCCTVCDQRNDRRRPRPVAASSETGSHSAPPPPPPCHRCYILSCMTQNSGRGPVWHCAVVTRRWAGKHTDVGSIPLRLSFLFRSCELLTPFLHTAKIGT